jgi:hypothetical protein
MVDDQKAQRMSQGKAEDDLPLEAYDSLSIDEIGEKLVELSPKEVEKLCRYEITHKNRKKLLRQFEDRIGAAAATPVSGREDPPPGEERPEKRREAKKKTGTIAREEPSPGEERPERRAP